MGGLRLALLLLLLLLLRPLVVIMAEAKEQHGESCAHCTLHTVCSSSRNWGLICLAPMRKLY